MTCKICHKPSGKRKTCSPECKGKLMSKYATQRRKDGIGWKGLSLGKGKKIDN